MINLRHRDKVLKSICTPIWAQWNQRLQDLKGWAKRTTCILCNGVSSKISKVSYSGGFSYYDTIFEKQKAKKITLQCAVSPVDILGAENNLYREWVSFDFKSAKNCEERWDKMLSRIEYTAAPDRQEKKYTKIFYTALYHSLIHPNLSQDADAWKIPGLDQKSIRRKVPIRDILYSHFGIHTAQHTHCINLHTQNTIYNLQNIFTAL